MSPALPHVFEPAKREGAPVLLLLHGTGADEQDLLPVGRLIAPGAALLAPRGWVVQEDGMPRFFRRIPTGDGSAYPFTFEDSDVLAQVDRLADFCVEAATAYELEGRPFVAAGFSNGANLAGAAMLSRPELVRAGVLLAPMPVLSDPPQRDLSGIAAFLGGGRQDPVATPDHVERLAAQLTDRGAAVEVGWHPGGHQVHPAVLQQVAEWFRKLGAALGFEPLP